MSDNRKKPATIIDTKNPLIILQTSNRFGDSDEGHGDASNPIAEAARHGREAVRVWRETVPDDLKPYCQLQIEIRTRNHQKRYDAFRRVFEELEDAGIPANFQFADPHDLYVFDPVYVDLLSSEFSCIRSYTMTEINFEHYDTFNVQRYALSAEARYAMDVIPMAARHGCHVVIPLQSVKWMHIGADEMNQPLMEVIRDYADYVIPVNEHIGPQHLPRQMSVAGMWLSGLTQRWGVEPQSWWFENARMITPGIFGQKEPDNTRIMPPELYRAMILQGALLGATVYDFEPFWDLFDYDNAHCWRDVIAPTLREVIQRGMIASREQVLEKTPVAYQYKIAHDINEFHENLRDVDHIHDEGLLDRAVYGVWDKFMEHEFVPNKSRYFFMPLLPPMTPPAMLERFKKVIRPGECDSEAAYEQLLNQYYPERDEPHPAAWTAEINGYAYVMQSHENLYERQYYRLELPRPVRGLRLDSNRLTWEPDPLAIRYHIRATPDDAVCSPLDLWPIVATVTEPGCEVNGCPMTYTVTAETASREMLEGSVNYLDFLVFSLTESVPGETITDAGVHRVVVFPPDDRPESQIVHPLYDGAEGDHRAVAEEIVPRIDQFKIRYDAKNWQGLTELYAPDYRDPNGYSREYVGRAWKWWFFRNQVTCFLRQIRAWDFSEYADGGRVKVTMFALCRALRRDDKPFGASYDGTLRIPRVLDEIVTFTWARGTDDQWRIVHTTPALPNFEEMLWNSRGSDQNKLKLQPGLDGDPAWLEDPAETNLYPKEINWLPPN